jgi:hypothetical protein
MAVALRNASARRWGAVPANLWPAGLAGCSGLASLGDGRLGLLFEQRGQDWRCPLAGAPERILFSMAPCPPRNIATPCRWNCSWDPRNNISCCKSPLKIF